MIMDLGAKLIIEVGNDLRLWSTNARGWKSLLIFPLKVTCFEFEKFLCKESLIFGGSTSKQKLEMGTFSKSVT